MAMWAQMYIHALLRLLLKTLSKSTGYRPRYCKNYAKVSKGLISRIYLIVTAQEDKLSVDKLEGANNWQIWKYQMQTILETRELFGHIDGPMTRPETSEGSSPREAVFDKVQKKTKALLVMLINSDLIYLVTECQTPREIWNKLKLCFEQDTIANKLFLIQQFFSMKVEESDSLEHLCKMKVITDQLAAIQAPIPKDEDIVALLLSFPRL